MSSEFRVAIFVDEDVSLSFFLLRRTREIFFGRGRSVLKFDFKQWYRRFSPRATYGVYKFDVNFSGFTFIR